MQATPEQVEEFLRDLSYNASYSFLEVGKNDDELKKIAEKRGVVLPSPDLAVFKARYLVTDKANRNRCILEKADVKEALATAVGKRVTIDHMLKRVVGSILDAELVSEEVIIYASLYKSSFEEEFDTLKQMFTDGFAGVSFEAWGERQVKEDGTYVLKRPHFAGVGLMIKEQPAEPTASVLELAKKMAAPSTFLHTGEKIQPRTQELARYYIYDFENMLRLLQEAKIGEERIYITDIEMIDFVNNKIVCAGYPQSVLDDPQNLPGDPTRYEVDLTPSTKVLESGRDIKRIHVLKENVRQTPDTEGVSTDSGKSNNVTKEIVNTMADVEKVTQDPVKSEGEQTPPSPQPTPQTDPKDAENAQLKQQLEAVLKEKAEVESKRDALQAKVDEYEKATREQKLAERRTALGAMAKDMKDDELLDDAKFASAQKDKRIAELEIQVKNTTPNTDKKSEGGSLEAGSADKNVDDPVVVKRNRIQSFAFPNGQTEEK